MICNSLSSSNVLFELTLHIQVNNFFSHVKMFSWVEPVLSNEDIKCLAQGTQHHAKDWIQIDDQIVMNLALYQLQCSPIVKIYTVCKHQ